MSIEPSIAELVVASSRGDRVAFEALVRRRQRRVLSIALGVTGDVATAEEVAQEVFLRAWSALGQLQTPEAFDAWLRTSTVRRGKDRNRSASRRRVRDAAAAEIAEPVDVDGLSMAERRRTAEQLLARLDDTDRIPLLLRYWEGLSAAEIGDALGISESAARKRLQRARHRARAGSLTLLGTLLASIDVEVEVSPWAGSGATSMAVSLAGVAGAVALGVLFLAPAGPTASSGEVPLAQVAGTVAVPASPARPLPTVPVQARPFVVHLDDVYTSPVVLPLSNELTSTSRRLDGLRPELPEGRPEVVDRFLASAYRTVAMEAAQVDALEAAGWADWRVDPVRAALSLEVARQRVLLALERHAMQTPGFDAMLADFRAGKPVVPPAVDEAAFEAHDAAAPTWDRLADRLADVRAAWPRDRVTRVDVYDVLLAAQGNDEARTRAGVLALLDTAEPEVARTALSLAETQLVRLGDVQLARGEVDALARWAEANPEWPLPVDLALHVGRVLLDGADVDRAAAWIDLHERAAVAACGEQVRTTCEAHLSEVVHRRAYLAALVGDAPATWEAALRQRARTCDARHRVTQRVELDVDWDGRVWVPAETSPYLRCLVAPGDGPVPASEVRLRLELVPAGVGSRLEALAAEAAFRGSDLAFQVFGGPDGSVVTRSVERGALTETVVKPPAP